MTSPVFVSVPATDTMPTRAATSLMHLSHRLPAGSQVKVGTQYSSIAGERNHLAETFLASEMDWILWVDSDMVVPPDLAQRLLRHGKRIVGGLFVRKIRPFKSEAGYVECQPDDADPLRPTDHPDWRFRTLDLNECGVDGMGLVEVDVVGAGALLMHREVFEAVEAPWFVGNVRNPSEVGANEDYNCLLRAKREGFGVYCDTTIHLEHIGSHGITVDEARGYWEAKAARDAETE